MTALRFDESRITDQKRLVRGEHLLLARTILRKRDEKHAMKWRVLTLAGGAPYGEIAAIRELMPKAYVLSVDIDSRCLERAIDAGADDVLECDVLDYWYGVKPGTTVYGCPYTNVSYMPPTALQGRGTFDIVNLDLCGSVTAKLARVLTIYLKQLITAGGVLMVTFSYGRDVVEMYQGFDRDSRLPKDVPDSVAGRLMYLGKLHNLRSIMVYRGAEMPMCSLLYEKKAIDRVISFSKIEPGDFELAVVYPDSANLYDCPHERIDSLRRKFSAIKASITRAEKTGVEA